jgi:hypothetical protein
VLSAKKIEQNTREGERLLAVILMFMPRKSPPFYLFAWRPFYLGEGTVGGGLAAGGGEGSGDGEVIVSWNELLAGLRKLIREGLMDGSFTSIESEIGREFRSFCYAYLEGNIIFSHLVHKFTCVDQLQQLACGLCGS